MAKNTGDYIARLVREAMLTAGALGDPSVWSSGMWEGVV